MANNLTGPVPAGKTLV